MNTTLTIKNFRVFDENGVDVQISPVTILTGCNSSGKSSIVKAILLLDSFLKQVKRDHDNGNRISLGQYKLDFSTYPNNMLGRYDKIVNSKSESKRITFAYTVYSLLLSKDVTVEFVFNVDKDDELNNGHLESFTLSTEEGIIYSSGKQIKRICNLNLIKGEAIKFMIMEFLIQNYSNAFDTPQRGGVSTEELRNCKEHVQKFIDEIGESRYNDIFKFMRHSDKEKKTIAEESKCEPEVLEWTYNNSSYFYIPLVELLKDCPKESIESRIKDEVFASKEVSGQLQEAFGKIVKDFFASDCHTFGEYFCMKETEFMANTVVGRFTSYSYFELFHPLDDGHDAPSVWIGEYFKIPQNYLYSAPRTFGKSIAHFSRGEENNDDFMKQCGIEIKSPEEEREAEIKKWLDTPVNFPIVYEILMRINNIYTNDNKTPYYTHFKGFMGNPFDDSFDHKAFKALGYFAYDLVLECILPAWSGSVSYVSSSRIDVKRLYPLDDATDFAQLLQRYFEGKRFTSAINRGAMLLWVGKGYSPDSFTNTCLKVFGIGESLLFDVDKDGLGVKIFLHRNDGTEDRLLADEGYGITQLVSIMLQIETAILTAKGEKPEKHFSGFMNECDTANIAAKGGKFLGFEYEGEYDPLKFYFEQQTIAIEEPEIHLHPRYQSLLAEMFVFAYKKYNIHFIIETHSEYLIRKMQLLVANKEMDSEGISLLYIYDPDEDKRPEGEPQVKDIGICSDGYLNESFGPGFFDEASSLSRQLLK